MLVLATGAIAVAATRGEGSRPAERPPLKVLRGSPAKVESALQPLIRIEAPRVERIRGLSFRRLPGIRVMSEARLAALGRRLALRERRRAEADPARLRRERRLGRAGIEFDKLAGLVPEQFGISSDASAGLDRVGGAYDFSHGRIIIVPELIATHQQLEYTLAHELTHALEDQRFPLRLATLGGPGERSVVRRAVIEGTATLVQDLYRRRYLHDEVGVAQRVQGARSVIGAAPGAYAVNAQAVFEYADGTLFARSLLHRAGGWRLVDRALASPPRRSTQILHPAAWPGRVGEAAVRLGVAPLLGSRWRAAGGGAAGEEQALVILLAGGIDSEASAAASGWSGGRFAVWRPRAPSGCGSGCTAGDVGVVAFRWHRRSDADQFSLAVPAYMVAGLLAGRVDERTWKVGDGYAALGSADRGSALAFAPSPSLSRELAGRAAAAASAAWGQAAQPARKRRNRPTRAYHVRKAGSRTW
ncbi:MAG: hypothetical protein ACRDK1_09340 [Solirubrobacterales bacterium]